ncbi:hypothetical protein [Spirillospora sp. NBC_01491]|uniref:hypothetical protein n=1 Tax=Spirillospora sp. NBC_01491 TaxID=2976007 RepID=UPI002E338C7D|nr:hypothetical protein [Spirillospora sp. NBC_01491]
MTAPALERPVLTVVPDLPAPVALPLAAVRVAFEEMLASLGVDTAPGDDLTRESIGVLLTLLMQASGATVAVDSTTAAQAAFLQAVAGFTAREEQ